jgi:ribosomal-protein-alanine N-acetyltransferase
MNRKVKVELMNKVNFDNLAVLLNYDQLLRKSLGYESDIGTETADEMYEYIIKWQTDNKASSYVIMLGDESIGLISLSHQSGTHARIGYWLASAKWRHGFATQAFEQVLEIAKRNGFTEVAASISLDNIASKRIWEKYGASFKKEGTMLTASLKTT